MSRPVTIGIAQITASGTDSLTRTIDAAGELFDGGADLVVLPELIVPGYRLEREFLQQGAQAIDGPAVQAWTRLAAARGGYIAAGFCERDGERLFNTGVLVGPEGVSLHYRKLHRFAGEKGIFSAGDLGLPVAETRLGTFGLCICYDLRFVETARILALSGAELICVPTAWLPGFDQQSWDRDGYCPQARGAVLQANLDQVFIACASQAGVDGSGFLGSSVVSDPYGAVSLGPLPGQSDELALVTADLDQVARAHDRGAMINPRVDRRSDVYGLAFEGTVL
jgi:predicted amidohydrolase